MPVDPKVCRVVQPTSSMQQCMDTYGIEGDGEWVNNSISRDAQFWSCGSIARPGANLSLQAERFRLLGRIDRRLVASGQADLRLDAQQLRLDGAFTVESIDYARASAGPDDEPPAPATVAENEDSAASDGATPIAPNDTAIATDQSPL